MTQQPPGRVIKLVKQEKEGVMPFVCDEVGVAFGVCKLNSQGIKGSNDTVEKQGIGIGCNAQKLSVKTLLE